MEPINNWDDSELIQRQINITNNIIKIAKVSVDLQMNEEGRESAKIYLLFYEKRVEFLKQGIDLLAMVEEDLKEDGRGHVVSEYYPFIGLDL